MKSKLKGVLIALTSILLIIYFLGVRLVDKISYSATSKDKIDLGDSCYFIGKDGEIFYKQWNEAVFLQSFSEVVEADKATFTIIDPCDYAKDKSAVYHDEEKIKNADPETFSFLDDQSYYAKDKDNIFYFGKILDGVNPATFKIIDLYDGFSRDDNHIYYHNHLLAGADPTSFEVLKYPNTKGPNDKIYLAKDNSYFYQVVTNSDELLAVPIPPSTPTPKPGDYLVGIWQDTDLMAAGWSNRYHLYPDGSFHFFTSLMDCQNRLREKIGIWQIKDGYLILTFYSEVRKIGGKLIKVTGGSCGSKYELIDATPKTIDLDRPTVMVSEISFPLKTDGSHLVTKIGKTQYWKFSDDPTGSGYEKYPE